MTPEEYEIAFPYNATFPADYPPLATTGWKQVTLALNLILNFLSFFAIAIAFWNRKYLPFKSKQLDALALSYVSIVFFSIGCLVQYQIIDQSGIFSYCLFWVWWCQLPLGANLFVTIVTFRMQRLYFLMVRIEPLQGRKYWLPILAPYVFVTVYMAATSAPWFIYTPYPVVGQPTISDIPGCVNITPLGMVPFLFVLLQIAQAWRLALKIRTIRVSFNEFKIMQFILWFMTGGVLIVAIAVLTGHDAQPFEKVAMCLLPIVTLTVAVWLPLGPAIWGFFTNKDKYLAIWKKGMKEAKVVDALKYGTKSQMDGESPFVASSSNTQNDNGDAIKSSNAKAGPSTSSSTSKSEKRVSVSWISRASTIKMKSTRKVSIAGDIGGKVNEEQEGS